MRFLAGAGVRLSGSEFGAEGVEVDGRARREMELVVEFAVNAAAPLIARRTVGGGLRHRIVSLVRLRWERGSAVDRTGDAAKVSSWRKGAVMCRGFGVLL